jgi:hypothetical protein
VPTSITDHAIELIERREIRRRLRPRIGVDDSQAACSGDDGRAMSDRTRERASGRIARGFGNVRLLGRMRCGR